MDMLPAKNAAGEDLFIPHAGGALFNSAVALARLEVPTAFFNVISKDMFGQKLLHNMQEEGIDVSLCKRTERLTTLAFVEFEDGQASYRFYDENSASRMVEIEDLPDIGAEIQALLFGAVSLTSEPCAASLEHLANAQKQQKIIVLDPNIRPDMIADETAYRQRLERMVAISDIVRLSDQDLEWMAPANGEQIIFQWLQQGVKIVVLSLGDKGVRAITANDDIFVPSLKVKVADTIGAGDTLNGAFLASLYEQGYCEKQKLKSIEKDTLKNALEFAVKAAAITVSRAGANPPKKAELTT